MNLESYHTFHFIGIGGMGMQALAQILIARGFSVSGSDLSESPAVVRFRKEGARIFIGHEASHVDGADCCIISSAIRKDNPELLAAEREGIPVFHRSDVLAALLRGGKGIAVAGAHGKSTTSAMIGQIFQMAGTDPTIVLGGAVDYLGGNSCWGKGPFVIAEADESDGSFLKFAPFLAVVTNIEDDHLDHYGTVEKIKSAFAEFISHISWDDGAAVMCIDNEGVRAILPRLDKKIITYGTSEEAEFQARNKRYEGRRMVFDVVHDGKKLGAVSLQVPGSHNMRDALGALTAALYCGISFEDAAKALAAFKGVKRRFETKADIDDVWIVDDYAHHPTEIEATLRAAREMGSHRIICAFQPHRYSRTKLLKDEFAAAFDDADVLYFTDIYSAGETALPGVTGRLIPDEVLSHTPEKAVHYVEKREDLAEALRQEARPGDMIITMGAGTISRTGEELIRLIKEKGLAHDHKE